jgi:hypothetical protein
LDLAAIKFIDEGNSLSKYIFHGSTSFLFLGLDFFNITPTQDAKQDAKFHPKNTS